MKPIMMLMIGWLVSVILLFTVIIITDNENLKLNEEIKRLKHRKIKLQQDSIQSYKRDSLYQIHLEECSFISKEQLYSDKYGNKKIKQASNYIAQWN
jgi:hypothetical protein